MLLTHLLLLLREGRLLILLVLIRIAGVGSLIRVAFVRRLEWNFADTCFEAKECEVGATTPGENRKE